MSKNAPRLDGGIPSDPEARHALIIEKPPRIPPLKEFGPEAKEVVASYRNAVGLPPTGDVPDLVATALHYPALYSRHTELGLKFYGGALPVRDRELAILRLAWLLQAPFEWGEHVAIGKRLGGMATEEIERVTRGSSDPAWNDRDRAILRAVEELMETAFISDETWSVLAHVWNEQQLIEFPLLVGHYQGLAYFQNALRLRLMSYNTGLSAR